MIASLLIALFALTTADETTISEAKKDADGFLIHTVKSPYQAGETIIRVLLPEKLEKDKRYPVVYVLPVEAKSESRFGDGLAEVKKLDLANKHKAVFVAPTFSHLPWYADHPTKPEIRQETYFLKVVLPAIEKAYPVRTEAEGRLLLGFSKSGCGAFSLLLRNPKLFSKAVAWDAPLMMDAPGKYGSGDIFATRENFAGYRVSELLEKQGPGLGKEPRLILLGYGNFRAEVQQAHALIEKAKVPHEYRDGPFRKHDWHSGWVAEAAEVMLAQEKSPRCSDR